MAQSESCVRHAVIALGYLNRIETGTLKHARSTLLVNRKTLFFHYNKAIGSLVQRIAEPSYAPEIGLVACLLFTCIEYLRGNWHTAFAHLSSGLKMISEWQQGDLHSPPSNVTVQARWGQGGYTSPLNKQPPSPSQNFLPTLNWSPRPAATLIEDSLLPIYSRAITGALLYGVFIEDIYDIPIPYPKTFPGRTFTNIHDAQEAFLAVQNPSVRFACRMGMNLFLQRPVTDKIQQDQAQLLACHKSWYRELQKFEQENPLSKEDRLMASALKINYYTGYVAVACGTDVCQMQYDAHLSSFKALIHHAKILIDSMDLPTPFSSDPSVSQSNSSPSNSRLRPAAHFTFDVSLIPSLHWTATRCRCPVNRREAVALLDRNPPREAIWDAEQHATVAKRAIEIEESHVDPETGFPRAEARLWAAVIDGNMDRNGGFWVTFALADWVRKGALGSAGRRTGRQDAQWEEFFVI